ncbi:alpha/beta hydrolase [Saccharopolyspora cebuensis]|uniref:Alpha/beta hydrolase n=1 Tax=Saccharopolyspora cebuensis TaxID=418759 RepID=A0ABV4CFZ9_9PSEU
MTSLRSRAVIAKYRITRRKRVFSDVDKLHESIRHPSAVPRVPRGTFRGCRISCHDVRGFPYFRITPESGPVPYHVLYLHGGAYVHGIEGAHWRFLDRLVRTTGCAVAVPLYPLAPEHTHREVLPVVEECYERTLGELAPDRQVVMGDSAGGGLGLHLAQWLRDQHRPLPRRTVLISPWLDVSAAHPAMAGLDRTDPYLSRPGLREAGLLYADGLSPHDPRVSPLYGGLDGLGPTVVFSGTRDVLLSDARRFRELAAQHAVPLDYEEYPGMFHGWMLQDLPEARQATRRLAALLESVPAAR